MHNFLAALALGIILAVTGCSQTGSGLLEHDPDRSLKSEVYTRLSEESGGVLGGLGIDVQAGTVTLYGVVRNASQRARALAIVRNTPGVKKVVDRTTD